jgi:hypothetical protein
MFLRTTSLSFLTAAGLLLSVGDLQAADAHCVLTLEVRQQHYTLDPLEHIKDRMNDLQFDVPVEQSFCDAVSVGDVLSRRFRWGSWLIRQNYGGWSVSVVGKRTETASLVGEIPSPRPLQTMVPAAPAPVADAPPAATKGSPSPAKPFELTRSPDVDDPFLLNRRAVGPRAP